MKINWNRRYDTIAVYTFLVLAASALFFAGVQNFGLVSGKLGVALATLRPFIFGFVIAYLLNPVYVFVDKRLLPLLFQNKISTRTSRGLSILLTYIFAGITLSLFFWMVIPQIMISLTNIVGNLQSYSASLQSMANDLVAFLEIDGISPEITAAIELSIEQVIVEMYNILSRAFPQILGFAMNFSNIVFSFVIGVIISIYMFMGKDRFIAQSKKTMYALFSRPRAEFIIDLAKESNAIFSGFITGKIIDSIIIGILCFIGVSIMRMPYAVLVSVIVGVTNVIPYFGPFIGAIPSFILILTESPVQALIFLVFIFLLQQFDGNILGPFILGDSTGLSAFWVIFAILIFGKFLGFAGMFIGVPVFAVVYSVTKKFIALRLEEKGMPSETASYAEHPERL